jgi:ribulose kinase
VSGPALTQTALFLQVYLKATGAKVMKHTFKAAVAALVLAAAFAGSVAAGPLEDARTAYMKADYARSSRLLRPSPS